MELSNEQIVNSIQLINVLAEAELPAVSSIRISRSLNELQEQQQLIQETRQDIVGKYQSSDADDEPLFHSSKAQAQKDRVQEIAEEKDIDPEDVDMSDVEVDVPEKVTEDHEYATQRPYVSDDKQEAMNDELRELFDDTVELDIQPIPADEIEEFEESFYETLAGTEGIDIDRDEDAEGLRPGDIAPITFLFPKDL